MASFNLVRPILLVHAVFTLFQQEQQTGPDYQLCSPPIESARSYTVTEDAYQAPKLRHILSCLVLAFRHLVSQDGFQYIGTWVLKRRKLVPPVGIGRQLEPLRRSSNETEEEPFDGRILFRLGGAGTSRAQKMERRTCLGIARKAWQPGWHPFPDVSLLQLLTISKTAVFKNQIDWIPLTTGSVRPTQGRTLAIAQAYTHFPGEGQPGDQTLLPSGNRDRLVDCMEEFVKYTILMRPHLELFNDRFSERKEKRIKEMKERPKQV
ncbi:hypothetical protein BO83DRAFT_389562 [Aspergillus eucalypticola CBS 122712]|uniref:Uncharacterized protein n=1 Tax=Aspergillus eucalypticola (strain CBS 122712 / IBT 29274) TaxID=1448314 RepID=A0A317VDA9_ASPEC|nr:uncharacterized protein BO83DRAFT_389562 [Aspergillus eucalypticola CBS 122712]PWY71251.1 hypothetical protein BO83DRAFT_389562 [Aspergillus eucalypticola CBS 122712]